MAVGNHRRLVDHYDQKYKHSDYAQVRTVPFVSHPRNRFEMAARTAFTSGRGRYLEIGAGSGNIALTVLERYDELVLTELSNNRAKELTMLFRKHKKVNIVYFYIFPVRSYKLGVVNKNTGIFGMSYLGYFFY